MSDNKVLIENDLANKVAVPDETGRKGELSESAASRERAGSTSRLA